MKKSFFIALLLAAVLLCGAFAKENPGAASYKTYETSDKNAPAVYFTKDISPDGLLKVYQAMGWKAPGKVGIKISTGEPPASNYLRPELIKKLVQSVDGTIVECNTAYGGSRASNAMHHQVVKDHGFLEIADFDLQDENGFMTIPIKGGTVLKEDYVGATFRNYNSYVVLSHFKGHAMGGFGGAIKNLSIGFGSGTAVKKSGKAWIHTGGKSFSTFRGGEQDRFLESMAEAAKGVCDYMNNEKGIAFVSVMNRLSVDCDCNGHAAEPDMHDIGILASLDPLAIDQAAIDMVYSAPDAGSLIERIETRNGLHTLKHGADIKLGKRNYRLINID